MGFGFTNVKMIQSFKIKQEYFFIAFIAFI
jgi:hypothetical protein